MIIQTKDKYILKDDEYWGEDDNVHCIKCKGLRSYHNENENKYYFNLLCECQNQVFEEQEKEQEEKALRIQIEKLKEKSLLGKRYANATFNNIELTSESQKVAVQRCKKYCEVSKEVLKNGYGIYIHGACGVGKTHLIACMANELTEKLHQVLITSFSEIGKKLRGFYNSYNQKGNEDDFLNELSTIDFLFIDDIGTEIVQRQGQDNFLQERIYDIVNARYNNLLPTIYTSNFTLNELISQRGIMEKTVDRIAETSKAILKIESENFRKREESKK